MDFKLPFVAIFMVVFLTITTVDETGAVCCGYSRFAFGGCCGARIEAGGCNIFCCHCAGGRCHDGYGCGRKKREIADNSTLIAIDRFDRADLNHDGTLSNVEVAVFMNSNALGKNNLDLEEANAFSVMDANNDGKVTRHEFDEEI